VQQLEDIIIKYVLGCLWFVLPAYFANSTPTVFGGGPPIDGGRLYKDGKPLLGPGKTWRGLYAGIFFGTLIGVIQGLTFEDDLLKATIRALLISFGALLGDMIGSFIKRRKGLKRGQSFLFMDQLGFIIVGTLLVILFFPLTIEGVIIEIFNQTITYDIIIVLSYLLLLLPLTFVVHILANLFWYLLGKQDVPL